jgi:hypothetical protein
MDSRLPERSIFPGKIGSNVLPENGCFQSRAIYAHPTGTVTDRMRGKREADPKEVEKKDFF